MLSHNILHLLYWYVHICKSTYTACVLYAQIDASHILPNVIYIRIYDYIYIYTLYIRRYIYSIGSQILFVRRVIFRTVKTWQLVVSPGVQLYSRLGCCHQLLGFPSLNPSNGTILFSRFRWKIIETSNLHPRRLTWNLKIPLWKRRNIYKFWGSMLVFGGRKYI